MSASGLEGAGVTRGLAVATAAASALAGLRQPHAGRPQALALALAGLRRGQLWRVATGVRPSPGRRSPAPRPRPSPPRPPRGPP